jgi:general secretion pathway protein G
MFCNNSFHEQPENTRKRSRPSVRVFRGQLGFTLLELRVVLVIIGLLATLVTVRVRSYLILGRQNAAKTEISIIANALNSYNAVHNRYPTNEEGLAALVEPSPKFPDGLLNKVPVDPWGNDYVYNCPGRDSSGRSRPFEVISYGADGREGGEGENADIISEQ